MSNNMNSNYSPIDGKPIRCQLCHGKMDYKGRGQYVCVSCGNRDFDDYGRVRNFLEEYGVAPSSIISDVTGVSEQKIDEMLKDGRIQIAKGSKPYLKCETCGAPIRYGRFCQRCIIHVVGGISSAFDADKIKRSNRGLNTGKMYFKHNKEN